MIYTNINDVIEKAKEILERGKKVKLKQLKETLSSLQNRALHLHFKILSNQLQDKNIEFEFNHITLGIMRTPYTQDLVKEEIWKPLMFCLFNKKSTTELITKEINEILDILTVHFGAKGINIIFPNKFDYYLEMLNKQNKI